MAGQESRADTRLHIRVIPSDRSLCGLGLGYRRYMSVAVDEIAHSLNSDGDVCAECASAHASKERPAPMTEAVKANEAAWAQFREQHRSGSDERELFDWGWEAGIDFEQKRSAAPDLLAALERVMAMAARTDQWAGIAQASAWAAAEAAIAKARGTGTEG